MDLGKRLLELRKSRKLSQETVAKRLNVSRQTISKWETDQSVPDIDKILPLCELYDITADELLTGNTIIKTKTTTPKKTTKKKAKVVKKPVIVEETSRIIETPKVVEEKPVIVEREVIVEKRVDNEAKAKGITLGVFLFFIALLWLILATSLFHTSDILAICVFFLICALGVCSIIYTSILYDKKEVVKEEKSDFKQIQEVLTFIVFIIYLIVSIKTMKWHITWLIWVIYALVMEIIKLIIRLWGEE